MRIGLTAFALLGIALTFDLATHTAQAQGFNFGGFSCTQRLPCDRTDPSFPPPDQILSSANACVTQNTAYTMPSDGYFENLGLDANNCLYSKPDAFSKVSGTPVSLQCCLKPIPAGGCTIQCSTTGR